MIDPVPPRTAYRQHEVAAMLGVHPDTIRNWIKSGELRAVRMGRTFLIPAAEVRRLERGDERDDT